MLRSDKLRKNIINLLKKHGNMTLGQLKKEAKIAHHYTLLNALELLKELKLIEVIETGDKLKSKIVRLK